MGFFNNMKHIYIMDTYTKTKTKMAAKMLIFSMIIAMGVNEFFNYDILEFINNKINGSKRFLVFLSIIAVMYIAFERDTYLPFLGDSVIPSSVLTNRVPTGADTSIKVNVPPNKKVVYWASSHGENKMPWDAYGNYENAGVTISGSNGNASLKVNKPVKYRIPSGRTLDEHIHYRYELSPGMMSRVHTVHL